MYRTIQLNFPHGFLAFSSRREAMEDVNVLSQRCVDETTSTTTQVTCAAMTVCPGETHGKPMGNPVILLGNLWWRYIWWIWLGILYRIYIYIHIYIYHLYTHECLIFIEEFSKLYTFPMDPSTVWEGTKNYPNYSKLCPKHFLRRYLDP